MPKSYDSATVELAMTLSTLVYVDENRATTRVGPLLQTILA
jgi:hypothetical protein